jgi:hypothetical protein
MFLHQDRKGREASLRPAQSFQTFTEGNEGNKELLVFLSSKAMLRRGYAWHGKSEPAWKFGPSQH